jgi:hypothetical protein
MRLKWVPSPRGTYHADYLNNRSVRGSDDMNGKWDNLCEIITTRTDQTTWTARRISSLMSPNLYVGAPLYSLFILWSPNTHLSGHDLSYLRTNEYIVFFFLIFLVNVGLNKKHNIFVQMIWQKTWNFHEVFLHAILSLDFINFSEFEVVYGSVIVVVF